MAVAPDNTKARHRPEQGVERARLGAEKVPGGIVSRGRLRNLVVRAGLDGVNQVGELDGILDEEYGDIIADDV